MTPQLIYQRPTEERSLLQRHRNELLPTTKYRLQISTLLLTPLLQILQLRVDYQPRLFDHLAREEHGSSRMLRSRAIDESYFIAFLLADDPLLAKFVCAIEKRRHAVIVMLCPIGHQRMIVALGTRNLDAEENS